MESQAHREPLEAQHTNVPSATTPAGNADILSATAGNADVPSATAGNADILSAHAGNADILSATAGNADILSAHAGNADVPSATAGNADILSAHAGNADILSATAGNADVPSATPHKGYYSRGYLPHFDAANIYQFITFRLYDSVPFDVIELWKQELRWHEGITADSKEAAELRRRIEKYADSGKGSCYLRDERIARLVQNALKHFDGERYRLIAWCIMPNHVHVLIRMMHVPLATIVQSWKSYTAREANKLLGRKGAFWMPDYFDRFIRDERHFKAAVDYILQNPVIAGLVEVPEQWLWSGFIPENIETVGDAAGDASVSDAKPIPSEAVPSQE